MQSIDYSISPAHPRAHRYHVSCRITQPDPHGQVVNLPAWIPGSYLVRDFARQILSLTAENAEGPVPMTQLDKQRWRCAPCDGPLTLRCEIHARDESVRAAYLDHRRGHFNGTSVFIRPQGFEHWPCSLRIEPPPQDVEGDWKVVTTLPASQVDAAGFGTYHADHYRHLIDHPVAMGSVDLVEFEVAGKPHAMALLGRHDADRQRLAADLARACQAHADMFGELPVPGYLFLSEIVAEGYGGLEHADCSLLQVARASLPAAQGASQTRSDDYLNLLGLCSHEYFHLWNVKRIAPQAVAESDLISEAHFADLWAWEGVTAYYDELALVRAGLLAFDKYLDKLARLLTRIERNPGHRRQSLAEASFDAWTKFYRPDENAPNALVSYYGKGSFVALALDLALRLHSDGGLTLDTIMREMWQRHGRTGEPVPDGGLEALCMARAGDALGDFFDRCVRGTEQPPVAELLAEFGVRAERTVGGEPGGRASPMSGAMLAALGVKLAPDTGDARLAQVLDASPAQAAALSPGDAVIAVDGLRVTAANLGARLLRQPAGTQLRVDYFRGDELLATRITVPELPADAWRFTIDPQAGPAAVQRRNAWLWRAA